MATNYGDMPLEAKIEMARMDPRAAREMALQQLIILSTELGYGLLAAKVQKDLAVVREMGQSIGASTIQSFAGKQIDLQEIPLMGVLF